MIDLLDPKDRKKLVDQVLRKAVAEAEAAEHEARKVKAEADTAEMVRDHVGAEIAVTGLPEVKFTS